MDTEAARAANHPAGDLATIGHEQTAEHHKPPADGRQEAA
jgi:hypothetical protein